MTHSTASLKSPTVCGALTLTESQENALLAFHVFLQKEQVAPTYADLAAELGVSSTAARQSIKILIRKGCLYTVKGRYRAWKITARGAKLLKSLKEREVIAA